MVTLTSITASTPTHASVRRAYVFGIAAIALWSTSATVAAMLSGKAAFHDIVFLMQIFAFAVLFGLVLLRRKQAEFVRELRTGILDPISTGNFTPLLLALAFSISITAYHSCFFYSLQTAPRLEANAINYLWPILLTIFSGLFHFGGSRLEFKYIILLILSFLGATSIVFDLPRSFIVHSFTRSALPSWLRYTC
jgi:drug/metabolite transporter (DMT)-like permease